MGVKDLLAKQEAEAGFISINELLARMSRIDGSSYNDAAKVLLRIFNPGNQPPEFIKKDYVYVSKRLEGDEEYRLIEALKMVAQKGEHDDLNCEQLLDLYGFNEALIAIFLAKYGLNIGNSFESVETGKNVLFPEWIQTMSRSPYFTDEEVICLLGGIDPFQGGSWDADKQSVYSRWEPVVSRSIRTGELKAKERDWDALGIAREWAVTQENLFNWCSEKGIVYPLPPFQHPPKIIYPPPAPPVYSEPPMNLDDDISLSPPAFSTETSLAKEYKEQIARKDAKYKSDIALKNFELSDLKAKLTHLSSELENVRNELQQKEAEIDNFHLTLSEEIADLDLVVKCSSSIRRAQVKIISVIAPLIYPDRLNIPDGGKKEMETICLKIPKIFLPTSFERAWREALRLEIVRMSNHEKFSQR